jgi:hypothetical protein
MKPELERQMRITEKLTNDKKANFKKSYFELENGKPASGSVRITTFDICKKVLPHFEI